MRGYISGEGVSKLELPTEEFEHGDRGHPIVQEPLRKVRTAR